MVELPEGLPTELVLETTTYQLNAGDEFTFGPDQFDLGEGFIPDDATIRKSVRGVEELPNMNWVGDNEFTALFDHDGRWQFEVVVEINNYVVLQPVTITVGTGVSENTKIVERAFFPTQYANVGGGNWLGDFYLEDYRVLEGEELPWTLERTDDGDFYPADVVIDHQGNDWCGIHVYNFTGETGLTSWKLTAESSLGGSWEKTFDINFVEMPEHSPTEIIAPQDVVYLEVGETYVTRISDYSFDVEVEDGADVLFELYSGEVEEHG